MKVGDIVNLVNCGHIYVLKAKDNDDYVILYDDNHDWQHKELHRFTSLLVESITCGEEYDDSAEADLSYIAIWVK